jgi:hypothetical protein
MQSLQRYSWRQLIGLHAIIENSRPAKEVETKQVSIELEKLFKENKTNLDKPFLKYRINIHYRKCFSFNQASTIKGILMLARKFNVQESISGLTC